MEKLVLIKTLSELEQLKEVIKSNEYVAFDTETTGVKKESKIVGFSIAVDSNTGYYAVLRRWNPAANRLEDLETLQGTGEIFDSLVGKSLVMHNGVFDCSMVYHNYRVSLIESLHTDTMILGHLLNENRQNGLKELGVSLFGASAKLEQSEMKESVHKNGGKLTKECYELYKADAELLGKYGAKDAILTMKLFFEFIEELHAENLQDFFFNESMPLLRGSTYDLNTSGLRVDIEGLKTLKSTLEAKCMEAKAIIDRDIAPHVKEKYPATKKTNYFNIHSPKQVSWLLFDKLGNEFKNLTKEGRELCKSLQIKTPYSRKARIEFIHTIKSSKGNIYKEATPNAKTGKMGRPKKIGDYWNYLAADKTVLKEYAKKHLWVEKLLEHSKNMKLLNTYVEGILERAEYGVITPSFLQHGTTSGRYSSRNPNFQNLPRTDKSIKNCIVARPGRVFVGADYSQLEPRVFASFSKDERLLRCFKDGDDFYSVIGAETFGKFGYSLKKDHPEGFASKFPKLRDIAKTIALAATYGTTAPKMATIIGIPISEAQEIIDNYFESFPSIKTFMLESHDLAKKEGVVFNSYGRPRHMPKAKMIPKIYGNAPHADLPYEIRNTLNLSVNHRVQSTGASIINRASIEFWKRCKELSEIDKTWKDVKVVLQVHDELVAEGPEQIANDIAVLLKDCMENTVSLPGVDLIAEPKIGKTLAELK